MDKAREQHNTLMDKGSEQLTAFGVSCYTYGRKCHKNPRHEESGKLDKGGTKWNKLDVGHLELGLS